MKYGILAFLLMATTTIVLGQKIGRTRFSIGPQIGVAASNPLRQVADNKGWGLGIGASVQAEHFFREAVAGLVSLGASTYAGRSAGSNQKNKAYIALPVRVGANFYAGNRFHLGGQVGAGFNSMGGKSTTAFSYSPQVGYQFTRNEKPLDLTVKYEGYAGKYDFGAWGLALSLIL